MDADTPGRLCPLPVPPAASVFVTRPGLSLRLACAPVCLVSAAAAAVVTLDGFALAVSPQPLRMVGRTALVYTAMGGIFASVEDTMSSLRNGREDIWNGAVAGCAAGMVFGVNSQKLSVGAGMCATLAATSAFLEAVNLTLGPTERVPADVKLAKQWGLAPPAAEPVPAKEE